MNYYQLLGLPRQATREQIRGAYLRLAGELHPDRHVGDGERERAEREKFKRIQEAYEVLRDPEKRRVYDLKHGAIPPPRRAHGTTDANTAAPRGPVRASPGVRRDVPDDWVRGSRRSVRFVTWFRTLSTVGIVLLVVTAIVPRIGHFIESHLSDSVESAEWSRAPKTNRSWSVPKSISLPNDRPANSPVDVQQVATSSSVSAPSVGDEIPNSVEQIRDWNSSATDSDLTEYLLRQSEALDAEHIGISFDSQVVASQDYSEQPGNAPVTPAESASTLPLDDFEGPAANSYGGRSPASADGLLGNRSRVTSPWSPATVYAPAPDLNLPQPGNSPLGSIDTGVARYDRFFPQRPPSLEKPAADSLLKSPAPNYGELPDFSGTSSYADSLMKTEPTRGYGTLDYGNSSSGYGSQSIGSGTSSGYGARSGGLDTYVPRKPATLAPTRTRTSRLYP